MCHIRGLKEAIHTVDEIILSLCHSNSRNYYFAGLKDFLANRTQHVRINKASSSVLPINFGVPQGVCPSTGVATVHPVY